ncbi:MAG: alpha/beta hydrolase [Nocardioidaceae bacterium]|nr:alpha/beta hydrolase [Nocardioidaceae bacterium]MCB8993169.1 alpha/beta hydrolase [Nocardioidaceae bacterium]
MRRAGLHVPMPITNRVVLEQVRARRQGASEVIDGVTCQAVTLPGTDATLWTYEHPSRSDASGALIWLHGGGFISGSAPASHDFCSQLAADLGLFVVNVDYRLAPEHPFPAGFDDCFDALLWIHAHAHELGINPDRIVVAGSSAGAGLAAAVAQRAHDEGLELAFQLLVYPMLDDRSALRRDLPSLTWSAASNRYAWKSYLGHPAGEPEERAYAVPARRKDLSGLAPAWIGIGDLDLFHEEALDYADRLRASGVTCLTREEQGMYHGADAARPDAPQMKAFRAEILQILQTIFDQGQAISSVD